MNQGIYAESTNNYLQSRKVAIQLKQGACRMPNIKMEPILKIKDLFVEVEGKEILKGINLSIMPGEIHAIMGPNGAGKSTMAYIIAGHPKYTVKKGSILYNGKDLTKLTPYERAKEGLFLAFQSKK